MISKGYFFAFVAVLIFALTDVLSRYAVTVLNANTAIYACLSFLCASVVLIVIAGPGYGGMETLKEPRTWLYGVLQITMSVIEIFVYSLITTTEANLLFRAAVLITIPAAWFFFNRKPIASDWIGSGIIAAGLLYIAMTLPEDIRAIAVTSVIALSIVFTIKAFVMETHSTASEHSPIKDRCRVTGYVLLVSSMCFILLFIGMAYAKQFMPIEQQALFSSLPSAADFKDVNTIVFSVFVGVFVLAAGMYYYFYSTKLAKAEGYMIAACLLPIFTLVMEYLASWMGYLDISTISTGDLIAGAAITLGALYMMYMRQKSEV